MLHLELMNSLMAYKSATPLQLISEQKAGNIRKNKKAEGFIKYMSETVKEVAQEEQGRKGFAVKAVTDFLSAKWLSGNINFFLFLSVLAIAYIANGHMADKTIRNINKTQKEIKELEFEYKTVKSEVMLTSEEANVLKAAEHLGLKVSNDLPQRLQLQTTKPKNNH